MGQLETLLRLAQEPWTTISIVIGFLILGLFIWAVQNSRVSVSQTVWKLAPIVAMVFIFGPFVSAYVESRMNSPARPAPTSPAAPAPAPQPTSPPPPTPVPAAKPTTAPPSKDCVLTIENPFVELKREPRHDGLTLGRVPPGQYRHLDYREVDWAGRMEGWFQIDAEGRTGWIVYNTITVKSKTPSCPP